MSSKRHLRRRLLLLFLISVCSFAAFSYISTPMVTSWSKLVKERLIWTSQVSTQTQPTHTKSYSLLAAVYSLPQDETMRNAVRNTWGQYLSGLSKGRLVFFVGHSKDKVSDDKLSEEEKTFKDIVRLDLIDSFKNQSLRSICIFRWIVNSRLKVQFLVRVDVKAFVNIPKLVELIKGISAKKYMLGQTTENTKPERNKESSWYVSQEEYPEKMFPRYLQSYGYLMTGNLVEPLLEADRSVKRIWIEDIYITGILTKQISVPLIHSDRFTYSKPENKCDFPKIIVCLCTSTYEAMKEVYAKVEMPDEECGL